MLFCSRHLAMLHIGYLSIGRVCLLNGRKKSRNKRISRKLFRKKCRADFHFFEILWSWYIKWPNNTFLNAFKTRHVTRFRKCEKEILQNCNLKTCTIQTAQNIAQSNNHLDYCLFKKAILTATFRQPISYLCPNKNPPSTVFSCV